MNAVNSIQETTKKQINIPMTPSPYDSIASSYDVLFGDDNPYYAPVTACERKIFDMYVRRSKLGERALDIGCGTGLHTGWLSSKDYETVGVDSSSAMVQIAVQKSQNELNPPSFYVADAFDETPLEGRDFDVVCCLGSTLNHLADWGGFAKVISSRLKVGGVFLFSYDNVFGIDTMARLILHEYRGYSRNYFRDILNSKVRALWEGKPFRNHWRVNQPDCNMEVGLTYETTKRWRQYLETADLEVRLLRGVHVFDCWGKRVLRASAGTVESSGAKCPHLLEKSLRGLDSFLASPLHRIAANVVGVAVKK